MSPSPTSGTSKAPSASLAWTYDKVGNVRSRKTVNRQLDASGTASAEQPATTVWYLYDAMNRVTVDAGSLSGTAGAAGTVIVRGASGRDILWDTAGRRTSMLGKASRTKQVSVYTPYGTFPYLATYITDVREVYGYDTRGVLETVSTAEQQATDNGQGGVTLSPLGSSNTRRASFSHDAMGRTTSQYDYDASGTNVVASRNWTWDTAGHAATQSSVLNRAGTVTTTSESSSYGTGTTYALGQAVSTTVASTTGGTTTTSRTDTSYDWYGGAVAKTVVYTPNTGQSATSQTQYTLDANGQATAAVIGGGQAHNVAYLLDAQNQVIRRDEAYTSGGAPHELWYRFDGREFGHLTGGRQRSL